MSDKNGFNIDELSKEQLLLYFDMIEELERRERENGAVYSPNPGQVPVHSSQAQIRVVLSGNGAGKTAMSVNEGLWRVKGINPVTKEINPVPARVIVLLDHPEKVGDVWLPEIRKWTSVKEDQLKQRGKPYVSQIIFDNGSEILFMFHSQDPLIFESIEYDMLIIDEPCPRSVWIALRRGGRKKGRPPKYLMVGTPIAGSWVRTELVEPIQKGEMKNAEVFKFGTVVNEKNLADNYIEEFSKHLSEKERRIRLEGEFYDLEGLALGHLFNPGSHILEKIDWDYEWPCVVAIDPHQAKPHHAVLLGVDPEGFLYYLDEVKEKATARGFARTLKEWYRPYRIIDIVCDSLGSSEFSGGEGFKSFIQILNEEGVRVRPTTWDDKSDEDFINRIQDALSVPKKPDGFGQHVPKLRFLRSKSYGIVHDIENVSWTKHRSTDVYKPKLDISNKDFLSCLKYALATNLVPGKYKARIYAPVAPPTSYVGRQVKPQVIRFGAKRRPRRQIRKAQSK